MTEVAQIGYVDSSAADTALHDAVPGGCVARALWQTQVGAVSPEAENMPHSRLLVKHVGVTNNKEYLDRDTFTFCTAKTNLK